MYRASEPILECFLLDCGCEYKGVGSYESIKKKAVGVCGHTHITSPSITWRNWCLARTGGMRVKCYFAGPKGETGGEC